MPSTFGDRIEELIRAVGDGELRGSVEVDQVYAHYQHEDRTLDHPRGGKAGYLGDPLYENASRYVQHLADKAITAEGSDLPDAMMDNMEHLSRQVAIQAPVEYNDLRRSGHPSVSDKGEVIRDRPPEQRRLTEAEIKAKRAGGRFA